MEERNSLEGGDDEISLIDLFAVLVRYRKFVAIFTAAVTLLAGLYLFVLPIVAPSLGTREVKLSWAVQVRHTPSALAKEGFPKTVIESTMSYFASPRLIARENRKFRAFGEDGDEMTDKQYNTFIQGVINSGKINVPKPLAELPSEFEVTMTVDEARADVAVQLFNAMAAEINASIHESWRPQLEAVKEATEASLASLAGSQAAVMSDSQNLAVLQQQVSRELSERPPFVFTNEPPFVEDLAQGRVKKLAIACFAALFLSVFIAFARNAWANIQKDPEASRTLKDAWNAGR